MLPISCNSPTSRSPLPKPSLPRTPSHSPLNPQRISFPPQRSNHTNFHNSCKLSPSPPFLAPTKRWAVVKFRCKSLNGKNSEDPELEKSGGSGVDWATSILLFGFYAGLMYYVFMLTPNQTPSMDMYFVEKLLNLKGNDGFKMNEVLVSLWYIMGLWPIVYSMLLLPSGRSSRSKVPVWPFLVLSCFGGAYALFPYFVLWKPPPPPVEESELARWPLNFMESKIAAGILFAVGLGLITYAGLSNGDVWREFYQYFRQSKFIHVMSLDFTLLSLFAPFWVYNDLTSRKWSEKVTLLLPLSLIPFLGPALYLILRPPVSSLPVPGISTTTKQK